MRSHAPAGLELILSPRLRQLGVFTPLPSAECVYVPWVVQQGAAAPPSEGAEAVGTANIR